MTDPPRLDTDKIDEVALALLAFTRHRDGIPVRGTPVRGVSPTDMSLTDIVTRVWKGLDWDILARLHAKGWISNPKSKAKSVVLTEEGERLAEEYVQKHFAVGD